MKDEYSQAHDYFSDCIRLVPQHFLYHYYLSAVHYKNGKKQEMFQELASAMKNIDFEVPNKSYARQLLHDTSSLYFFYIILKL